MHEITAHIHGWMIALAAALVASSLLLYRRTAPPVGTGRRGVLAALRIASFAILSLLLAGPVLVSRRVETRAPLAVVLVDRSRSMAEMDAGGRSRIAAALADASTVRGSLEKAGAIVAVHPFAAGLEGAPVPPDSAVAADGDGTDIEGAIDAVVQRYRPDGLSAVIVLSDGRVTRGISAAGGPPGVPVFAVGYGDTSSAPDASIDEVIVDRVAYRGVSLPVEAVVRARRLRGFSVDVRLLEDGRLRRSAAVSVSREDELISVPLEYVPEREGRRRLTVEVVVSAPGEDRGNNGESVRIDVRAERLRLLYIDQFADWNTAFLRDLVGRSKRLEADIVLWKADRGFFEEEGERPWTFPRDAAELEPYDLVVVSDDARLFATPGNAGILARYVEKGGSVLFLADEQSPLGRSGSFEMLEPVLPVRRERLPRPEYSPGSVRIATGAQAHPLGAGLASAEEIDRMPPLPARIGGIVASADAAVPLVIQDPAGVTPFVAVARRGEGLGAAVLGFPLWRWKLAGDEGRRLYESLLGGLVLNLAEGPGAGSLVLDADRTEYRTGDRVRLSAFIGDRRPPEAIRCEIARKGRGDASPAGTILLAPHPRRRGLYRADAEGLAPGDYIVVATEMGAGGTPGPSASTEFSVSPVSVELLDLTRDAAYLSNLAAESGGAYLESSGAEAVAARIDASPRRVELASSRELRGETLLFIAIVALLGAEWIARKAWGLV